MPPLTTNPAAISVSVLGDFGSERDPAPIDDVLVPAGLHKGYSSSVAIIGRDMVLTLAHGCSSSKETD